MKKIAFCIAVVSGFAASIPLALAQPKEPPRRGQVADSMFEEMDTNHDGFVSREEFNAFNNKRFDAVDTNHDGKISHEEMEAAREKAMNQMAERMREQFDQRFDAADANHDGALSREEAQKMPRIAQDFDEIDANHDGKVTRDEIRRYFEGMRPGAGGMTPRQDGQRGR